MRKARIYKLVNAQAQKVTPYSRERQYSKNFTATHKPPCFPTTKRDSSVLTDGLFLICMGVYKDGDHKKHSYRAAHTYRDHIWEYPTLPPGYRVGSKGAAPSYFSSDFFSYSPLQATPSPENPDLQVHW